MTFKGNAAREVQTILLGTSLVISAFFFISSMNKIFYVVLKRKLKYEKKRIFQTIHCFEFFISMSIW